MLKLFSYKLNQGLKGGGHFRHGPLLFVHDFEVAPDFQDLLAPGLKGKDLGILHLHMHHAEQPLSHQREGFLYKLIIDPLLLMGAEA